MNAELITAQRYEAKEKRHEQEVQRRTVQDKARKTERKLAHQKINARSFAKSYLFGIREEAIKEVASLGILVAPKVRHIEEEVVPWIMDKVVDFLYQDSAVSRHANSIVDIGFADSLNQHGQVIKAKYAAIEQAKVDAVVAAQARVKRKADRRKAREVRQKDFELEKYKDQIQRNVILKGEVVEVLHTNLVEYHGFFSSEKYLGSLGGQLQQIHYVIEEISKKYPQGLKTYMEKKVEENVDSSYFEKPNNLRELLQPEHLEPLLMQYMKAMKNEAFELFLHPICQRYLDERETSYDDLTTLSDEDFVEFVKIYKGNKSKCHR